MNGILTFLTGLHEKNGLDDSRTQSFGAYDCFTEALCNRKPKCRTSSFLGSEQNDLLPPCPHQIVTIFV